MVGWKPKNERTEKMDRNEILKKVLAYAETKSSEGYHYAYAFGFISAVLTDEQLKDLEKGLK